jgi:hypothetical protein
MEGGTGSASENLGSAAVNLDATACPKRTDGQERGACRARRNRTYVELPATIVRASGDPISRLLRDRCELRLVRRRAGVGKWIRWLGTEPLGTELIFTPELPLRVSR